MSALQSGAGAIVVAAGASLRMQGIDKIWVEFQRYPLIAQCVQSFESTPAITTIVLVVAGDCMDQARELRQRLGWRKVHTVVAGGVRRRDSVLRGLEALPGAPDMVIVHDGARPLVTIALIEAALHAAVLTGSASAAVPVTETIKRVGNHHLVVETPPRAELVVLQTPQAFRRDLLLAAHRAFDPDMESANDAQMVAATGSPVMTFPGDDKNLLVTTAADLALVTALWQTRVQAGPPTRISHDL